MALRVRNELCVGCGLCVESCPRGAISLQSGQAQINPIKCNRCGLCLDVCPRGAIVEMVPLSEDKLEANVSLLMHRTNELIDRIENLRRAR